MNVDPLNAGIHPDCRVELIPAEGVRTGKLCYHRSRLHIRATANVIIAPLSRVRTRQPNRPLLSSPAVTSQSSVELPKIAAILLPRDDITGLAQNLPVIPLQHETGDFAGPKIHGRLVELVLH